MHNPDSEENNTRFGVFHPDNGASSSEEGHPDGNIHIINPKASNGLQNKKKMEDQVFNKEYVQVLLERRRIGIAIALLLDMTSNQNTKLYDSFILQSARYKDLEKKKMEKMINKEDAQIQGNQIIASLKYLMKKVDASWTTDLQLESSTLDRVQMNHKILMLTANPDDTSNLKLSVEAREIEEALKFSKNREDFEFKRLGAIRVRDFTQALLDEEATIVHFSGHGGRQGELFFLDNEDHSHPVSAEGLNDIFKLLKENICCVFLNACFTEIQAKAIQEHIPYVIGMNRAVPDAAAIQFARAFYQSLGSGESFVNAFQWAVATIKLYNLPGAHIPVLKINGALTHKC